MNQSIIVESVIALSPEEEKELRTVLKKKFGSDQYVAKLNPALLGGLRITVGSTQYDASVQAKLQQLGQ
ncbi:MAG TPA: F0F1 ATP synthase subunit delta [Candidatus Saccharimonadia bacterium]|nr:F0F1 ATP synthase subunit delta [Candidatus Saccharimonadia bacterium]